VADGVRTTAADENVIVASAPHMQGTARFMPEASGSGRPRGKISEAMSRLSSAVGFGVAFEARHWALFHAALSRSGLRRHSLSCMLLLMVGLGCSAGSTGTGVDRLGTGDGAGPAPGVTPSGMTPGGSPGVSSPPSNELVDDPALLPGGGTPGGCTAVVCAPPGGQYCGSIGDGCGGGLECGGCPAGFGCESGLCVGGPDCPRRTACAEGSANFCGAIGDGCGGALDCGGCQGGLTCNGGVCVAPGCVPLTCSGGGTRFCGVVGDGCGGALDCGECADGAVCGGGGIDGVCAGGANCTPVACDGQGGEYCGVIGDGCGGILDCGTCLDGAACGQGVCPGTGSGCSGLQCQIDECANGASTTLVGTVFAPNGTLPMYNALVYVPNAPVAPLPDGAECSPCSTSASGQPIATALTDTSGRFVLENVPTGNDVPLVIQVGKWRRQVTIPSVQSCATNPITNPELTRLPRTQAEGDIPRIAVTTGDADALECLLRRLGVADQEFTTNAGNGRVHLYAGGADDGEGVGATSFGNGTPFPYADTLWGNPALLASYDMLMFSCEGGQIQDAKSPYYDNIFNYAQQGGRLFLSHLHFNWLNHGPDEFQGTAEYIGVGPDLPEPITALVDTTHPRGAALADWLVTVGASPARGQLEIYQGQHSVSEVYGQTQRWIYVPQNPNDDDNRQSVQYMTFNTPVGAAAGAECGRVVLTDIHINTATPLGGGDSSQPDDPFPTGCANTPFSAQAQAMAFMFFDLSACVTPDDSAPVPPPPAQPTSPVPPVATPAAPPPPPPPPPPPVLR
jgi:hypothetical protein